MKLLTLLLSLLWISGLAQDPKISKYNREIDSLKRIYKMPTALGYTKTVIRDEDGIRETMILFYKKGGETEEIILWTKQLGSKDSIIILGQLTTSPDFSVPKDSVIKKPVSDCPFHMKGVPVYSDNRLFAVLFDSRCRKKRYFLVKEVVPNKSLLGTIDEQGIYIGEYLIPIEWWRANVVGSLTKPQIQWIREHFKLD